MRILTWLVVVLSGLALIAPSPLRAADRGDDAAVKKEVAQLLEKLESVSYKDREAATLRLEELPAAALPQIEASLAGGALSPEVSQRLAERVDILRRNVASTKFEDLLREQLAWDRRISLAAYDGGGHTNPKWDAAAHEAIVLYVRPRYDQNRSPKDNAQMGAALKKAIDLGCDDPFLLYCNALFNLANMKPLSDPRALMTAAGDAAERVVNGNYPAFCRMEAALRRGEALMFFRFVTPDARKRVPEFFDKAMSLIGPSIKDGASRRLILGSLTFIFKTSIENYDGDVIATYEHLRPAIAEAAKGTAIPAMFEADYLLTRAYAIPEGRSNEARKLNPEQTQKLFEELKAKNRAAVEAALAFDPDEPDALNRMLRHLNLAAATHEEFDKWFEHAMRVYPNNLVACQYKYFYLIYHGTPEERVAFGRWCIARGNFASRIPLVAVDIHYSLAPGNNAYYARDDVWQDHVAAFEGYLKRFPDAAFDRSMYACTACKAEHWDVAKAQFEILGDNVVLRAFASPQQMKDFRRRAAEFKP